jgi:hypothetical protein
MGSILSQVKPKTIHMVFDVLFKENSIEEKEQRLVG